MEQTYTTADFRAWGKLGNREGKRKGGLKGGPARARKLSARQRSAIARKASKARWAGVRKAAGAGA